MQPDQKPGFPLPAFAGTSLARMTFHQDTPIIEDLCRTRVKL